MAVDQSESALRNSNSSFSSPSPQRTQQITIVWNYNNQDFHNAISKLQSSTPRFGLEFGMDGLEESLANEMYGYHHHNSHQRGATAGLMTNGSSVAAASALPLNNHSLHANNNQLMLPGSYMNNSVSRSLSSRKYACKMCTSIFESKTEYQMHFQSHMREPKPYKCSQCPKCFANSSYLSQHMRIHLGIKPYHCDICKKKFTQLSHLQQHLRTHTGDKPYKCPSAGCTKAFSQLSNLQSHSRCHQTDKPFKCNSCYKCFFDESSLLDHIPKHKDSKHLKTHICKYCGKSYTQETYLLRHMAKHLDKIDKQNHRNNHHHHDTIIRTNGDTFFPGKLESPTEMSGRSLIQEDLMSSFSGVSYNAYPSAYNAHLNGYSTASPVATYDMISNNKNASSAFCIPTNRSFGAYGGPYDTFNMRNYAQQNGGGGGGGESKSGSMNNNHFTYDHRGFGGMSSGMPTMLGENQHLNHNNNAQLRNMAALKDNSLSKQQRY